MPVRTSYTQGTPNWVDLQTPDQGAAKAFYSGLFGWTYDDQPMPDGRVYSMAMLGEHTVAALAPQPPEMTAVGAPPMWNTYLAVDSADDAAAKAEAAGGTITWNELITTDPAAVTFYRDVVGLTTSTMDMGAGEYTLFEADGQMVGGTTPPQRPRQPNWTARSWSRRSIPRSGGWR